MMATEARRGPNILITGTPGTDKTTMAGLVATELGGPWKNVNVGAVIEEKQCHDGYDAEYDTMLLNEDKLLDELEERMQEGFNVVDYHSCDFFPERWFDLVLVLRTDNSVLYDRLEKRNYNAKKLTENIECEIMQVVLEEARSSYRPEVVVELSSNTVEEMEQNIERVRQWADQHLQTHSY